ncbi:MAG TPA: MarR family transcriptional regulator [Candidatus Acidoferrales bacterium]|jgi:MarR family transcriptional regulator for hemolysin|nr:MarR family transcriptional regulator [Candidatus Acidoferrales bacterium]
MAVNLKESARQLLEVIPLVMQDIRSEMRRRGSLDLSVPQFRALAFVDRNEGASLWEVARHMGLTPPSTSRLVDNLIERDLMTRTDHPDDRRRVRLTVTSRGHRILQKSADETVSYLARKLSAVDADRREIIEKAVEELRIIFASAT